MTGLLVGTIACNKKDVKTASTTAKPKLAINPYGTSGVKPDMSKVPADLQKVFAYIDNHIDEHVENLQKWIQQPSISNSGEGIPESAEMVKGFFDKLGCQTTRVFDVDTMGTFGTTLKFNDEAPGSPWTQLKLEGWWNRTQFTGSITPNPAIEGATPAITYAVNVDKLPITIELFNAPGERIRTIAKNVPQAIGERSIPIGIRDLPNGMYVIRITSADDVESGQFLIPMPTCMLMPHCLPTLHVTGYGL